MGGWEREVLSVDEVTASANEVTDKAGFIGRDIVACLYRELGYSKFGLEGKASNAVLASKASSVGQHPHAGHERARGPVTSTGRREVVAGLPIIQASKLWRFPVAWYVVRVPTKISS